MKSLHGKVISTKMAKTAVVEVTSFWQHPLYQKRVKTSKRYLAHNELDAKEGQEVVITSTRPISKLKRWTINKIN